MFAMQRDSRFRPGAVNKLQRRLTLLSALPDDYFRFRALWCGDNGNAWLNDSCFFLRNLIDGLAEPFLVVETDWGTNAYRRLHGVTGIKSPPMPVSSTRISQRV